LACKRRLVKFSYPILNYLFQITYSVENQVEFSWS
jgi:hypothetical protein